MGSLTTPGCSQAVVWTVFEKPIPISKSQVSYSPANTLSNHSIQGEV